MGKIVSLAKATGLANLLTGASLIRRTGRLSQPNFGRKGIRIST
jgi:hypothetical protein